MCQNYTELSIKSCVQRDCNNFITLIILLMMALDHDIYYTMDHDVAYNIDHDQGKVDEQSTIDGKFLESRALEDGISP